MVENLARLLAESRLVESLQVDMPRRLRLILLDSSRASSNENFSGVARDGAGF